MHMLHSHQCRQNILSQSINTNRKVCKNPFKSGKWKRCLYQCNWLKSFSLSLSLSLSLFNAVNHLEDCLTTITCLNCYQYQRIKISLTPIGHLNESDIFSISPTEHANIQPEAHPCESAPGG